MFPFVLTNSCGLKMHGSVLHLREEMDPHHLGGMVSRALNSSAAGAGDGGVGGRSPRRGVALSPAQLPAWLRDTVREGGSAVLLLFTSGFWGGCRACGASFQALFFFEDFICAACGVSCLGAAGPGGSGV